MLRVLVLTLVLSAIAHEALACGVPGAGGPAGVTLCNLKDRKAQASLLGLRLSVAFAHSATTILFFDATAVNIERSAVVAAVEYRLRDDLVLTATGGAVISGAIDRGVAARVLPGPLLALSLSWRLLGTKPMEPLLMLTTTLSFVTHATEVLFGAREQYTAFDLRVGLLVGKTFWDVFTPYAVARLFGGPVFYRLNNTLAVGSDLYHFQIGAGASVSIARRVDLFVEGIPLGERAVNAGIGLSL